MRSISLPAGMTLTLILVCGSYIAAAPLPYTATVTQPEVEVRSGRSADPNFYPTNRLHRGDVVEVLKEFPDGWLGIRPPRESFSWIEEHSLRLLAFNIYSVDA